jgi:hypothetical protein
MRFRAQEGEIEMNNMKLQPTGRAPRTIVCMTVGLWVLCSFVVAAPAQTKNPNETSGGQPDTARIAGDELQSERTILDDSAPAGDRQQSRMDATGSPFVKRATFTTAIEQREPLDEVRELGSDVGQIFFFSEIVDREGHAILHRWKYEGEIVAEVPIEIGGARWRVHSSKTLMPSLTGEWSVEVVDMDGTVLHEASFEYGMEGTGAR